MSPDVRLELQRLLSSLCDDELTPAELERIEELLADNECRRAYLEYIDMNAWLLSQPTLWRGRWAPDGKTSPRPAAPGPPRPGTATPGMPNLRGGAAPDRPGPYLSSYMLVALATLAVSILGQLFWWSLVVPAGPDSSLPGGETADLSPRSSRPVPRYIATLTQTAECVWEDPDETWRAGTRLAPGELRLLRGSARIHFDTGADLVLEGPTELRIRSGTAATLIRGKVVFHADETAAPFDLFTPFSTLADWGTEYAVAVDDTGEEIHVFDGVLQRTPRPAPAQGKPDRLRAGEARRYSPAPAMPGEPTPLDPTRFIRWLAEPGQPPADPAAGLLAYEGFDYKDPQVFRTGQGGGGIGWARPWTPDVPPPPREQDPLLSVLNVKESLTRPGAAGPSPGGCLDCSGTLRLHRRLATPVRLDADAVYYLSFLFRRDERPAHPLNSVTLLLCRDGEDRADPRQQLVIGVGGSNHLFAHIGRIAPRTPLPLNSGETYLLVAKIAARRAKPDQVLLRVYAPDEPIEYQETGNWSSVSDLFRSDQVFDCLEVHLHSKSRQMVDEIRLGTTWQAVTSPWAGRPPR